MQRTVVPLRDLNISLEDFDADAVSVVQRLQDHGHKAYIVGGCLRDLIMGHHPKDYDISTDASPEEVRRIFRNSILIGRRFRLVHVMFKDKVIEVSTFRAGDPDTDDLIIRDNTYGTEEEDALRRDFTINGLYCCPVKEEIIDYVDGITDIKAQVIKAIGNPTKRFMQDPVRMIRLIKFRARFGFNIDTATREALLECRHEILKSSQARVLEEVLRMLESGSSHRFFEHMVEYGVLAHILPGLSHFLESDKGSEVYTYLKEIDTLRKEHGAPQNRGVLISALAWPRLWAHLMLFYGEDSKALSAEKLFLETTTITEDLFSPFLQLPRKLFSQAVNILMCQLRFTPLSKVVKPPVRIPGVPDFAESLAFFELRTHLSIEYNEVLQDWKNLYDFQKDKTYVKRTPSKRRRRRSRRT